jgi:predicted RNA-binding Zn ribbon-like protein
MTEQHQTDRRGLVIPHANWPLERNAPGQLEIVRRFVNTQSWETGAEILASARELGVWATSEGVPVGSVSAKDLSQALRIRQILRTAIESRTSPVALDSIAASTYVRISFAPPRLEPQRRGVQGLFGALLIAAWSSVNDGTWDRLMACHNEHCRWIVYDHSKSKTVQWCSDKACGSRARAQRYRDRQRASGSTTYASVF